MLEQDYILIMRNNKEANLKVKQNKIKNIGRSVPFNLIEFQRKKIISLIKMQIKMRHLNNEANDYI